MTDRKNVLFLCTGNSARSQMAEAFLRHVAGAAFNVYSAGLEPKGIHPLTVRVMSELGIDLGDQYSKSVKEYMGRVFFHYVITVCANADERCPQALWANGGVKLHWHFDDPAAFEGTDDEKLAEFRRVRDQIGQRIEQWVAEFSLSKV